MPLGPPKLVSREGKKVHAQLIHIYGDVSHRLHSVSVKQSASSVGHSCQRFNWLNGPHFVVCQHDAHQSGVVSHGRLQVIRLHNPVFVHRQICHLPAHLLERFAGVEDGFVFNLAGDDVSGLFGNKLLERPVVCLRSSRGEENFSPLAPQCLTYNGVSIIYCTAHTDGSWVDPTRIEKVILHVGLHGFEDTWGQPCGGCCICIDHFFSPPKNCSGFLHSTPM